MKLSQRVLFNRITSGMLSILLVVGTVLNPVTMLPAFATASFVKLNYENHDKNAVELYVQAEEVNYKPGDEMELTLYVQNNSEEALSGVGLSWNGDEDAFEEAEFIGYEELEAELNDKGNVVNLNLEAGEIVSLGFVGTLADNLEDLNRREISFFYGAETESGANVTDRTSFEFTVGLFNELSMEFADGNELALGETGTIDVKLSLNDLGYYYEAGVEEEEIVEVATDSNTIVATDSNTEIVTASDSDAELATDSNSEEEDTEVATDSNTEDDVEVASDSDSEEEEDIEEEYVFEITDIELNMDTYGAKFKNAKVKHATVADGKAEVEATIEFEMDDDAELGEYFGTLQAAITSDKKVYNAEIGFQYEVVDELITTGFKKHGLFTAELDNFTVNVQVPKGAFDEKVELSVTELATDSEEFKEAEEAMANHDRQYDGMMALDICFLNDDGEEVEPKEGYNVQVSIEMNAEVLPEGTDTESLMVHHIAETATASDAAEVVVEDVADTADVTAGLIEMKETVEAPVVAAEFEVERFSTFTITWNNRKITVKYAKEDLSELSADGFHTTDVDADNSFNLNSYMVSTIKATDGKTYAISKIILASSSGSILKEYDYSSFNNSIRWNNGYYNNSSGLYYYNDNGWQGNQVPDGAILYLVYESYTPLPTFKGVDTSGLINVHLKDYKDNDSVGDFTIGKHGDEINQYTGGKVVRQNIVNDVLGADGYPIVSKDNSSLKTFFTGGVDTNNLFQMDSDGYYYYDSSLNFAHLDDNGSFDLYYVPYATEGADLGSEPQFMPYNTLTSTAKTNTNGSDTYTYYPYAETKNYYFGMAVEFDFIMPEDGMVNGNPMIFEFDGDDDVWVFIDDVLVLDIGGVHLNCDGSINFATGEVNVLGIAETSIYDLYDAAKLENTVKWTTLSNGEKIFKDYSSHTLKFFYMERGAGGSNCKLKFNLPAIPAGTINFQKDLVYANVEDAADLDFEFKTFVNYSGEDDGTYELYTGAYEVYDANNLQTPIRTGTSLADGIITLKDGQVARLVNGPNETESSTTYITALSKFYVQEIGATSDKYKVTIDDVHVTQTTGDNTTGFTGAQTEQLLVGDNPYIVFENRVVADNQFNVKIQKDMADGTVPNESFNFKLFLGTNETLYTGKYDVYDVSNNTVALNKDVSATNGIISIKAGQYAEIVGLVGGNTVKVQEVNLDNEEYTAPEYAISGAIISSTKEDSSTNKECQYAKGVALEGTALSNAGGAVTVIVTNAKRVTYTSLNISKKVAGNLGDWSKAFTFKVTATNMPEGITLPETEATTVTGSGTYTKNNDGTATIILKHGEWITLAQVPVKATITVTENDYSVDGYETTYSVNGGSVTKSRIASTTLVETAATIAFINEKNAIIDTGITMDTLPYILILLAVIGGIVFTVIRKRKDDDLD